MYLRISVRMLYSLPIRKVKIGRATRWRREDLDSYISMNLRGGPTLRKAS